MAVIGKRSASNFWRWLRRNRRQCHQLRCSIIHHFFFNFQISFFLASFPSSICWFLHHNECYTSSTCDSHIASAWFQMPEHHSWILMCCSFYSVKTESCFALDRFTCDHIRSSMCDRSDSVGLAVRLWIVGKGLWVVKRMWLQISLVRTWVCNSESIFLWIWLKFMTHVHARLGNSLWPSTSKVS